MRRVRIQTIHPLPPLKAWYPLPQADTDVAAFKQRMRQDLGLTFHDIGLEVDGFDLLDALPVDSVVDGEKDIVQ